MKINKILAAGVAATLAVTSLSAVVSAEVQTKTFDVYQTNGSFWGHSIKFNADVNKNIAQKLRQAETGKIVLTQLDEYVREVLNYKGFIAYLNEIGESSLASWYAADPSRYNNGQDMFVSGVSITATGYQHIGDTATVTKTFTFEHDGGWAWFNSPNATWKLVVLDDSQPIYHEGEFASYFFTEITSLQLDVQISGWTLNEDEYNYWSWISNGGDNSKRYLDLGDIAVYQRQADTAAERVYGLASETDNTADLTAVKNVQATEVLKSVPGLTNVDGTVVAADIGKGVIIGSKALNTDVGSPIKANQKAAQVTGLTTAAVQFYTVGLGAAYDSTKLTALGGTTAVTKTQPILFNGELKTTGNLYTVTYNGAPAYIYSTTTYADLAALQAATFTAADVMTTNAASANPLAILTEESVNDHMAIVPATATDIGGANTVALTDGAILIDYNGNYSYQLNAWSNAWTAMDYSDTNSTSHLLAYAFANGGWFVSKAAYGDAATADWAIGTITYSGAPWAYWNSTDPAWGANANTTENGLTGTISTGTARQNGWIPKTTYNAAKQVKNVIEREDVKILSSTNSYTSSGQGYAFSGNTATTNVDADDNQSYLATYWDGTNPYGFAGLASQVADFFNKQDNGTITFTFAADSGATSGKWADGVPSTEVGLKGFSSEVLDNFALFFNYNNTTGTMLSKLKIDKTAGSVTFDIGEYLDDCGGLTKATLENIYYGLDDGIKYNATTNKYGLWVSKVELAYDDAGKSSTDADTQTIDDDDDDDNTAVVADDDDDDDDDDFNVVDDDDDDDYEDDDDDTAAVISDDDDDDTAVNNDVDIVSPTADDDSNPGTGVGLAVIPAIVAAAAVVVSKKRK